jgi:hypothetical protein
LEGHASLLALAVALRAVASSAEPVDARALLAELGLSPPQVQQVLGGELVRGTVRPASERELVASFAFRVGVPPETFVSELRAGLVTKVDPTVLASREVGGATEDAAWAALTLEPDAATRAQAYVTATAGGPLNLSPAEIASFKDLDPTPAAVLPALRAALRARLEGYRSKGLAGIGPYARAGGASREPADELRTATQSLAVLKRHAPSAYQMLLDYPSSQPPGAEHRFRWSQIDAHGTPAYALTHAAVVPEGDAFVVVQRMFYVSLAFNAEQAVAAILPVEGGSVVLYANHTSTDQVAGFGGGTKRSIGSRLLESELEALAAKLRDAASPS